MSIKGFVLSPSECISRPLERTSLVRGRASEIKFLVDPTIGEAVRRWARLYLRADPHGTGPFGDEYQITSLYWDTPQYHVFHRNGSHARAKYRVRRYGHSSTIFLERKLRRPNALVKRRTCVLLEELTRLREPHLDDQWGGHWFRKRVELRSLSPVCQVSYSRMASSLMSEFGPARLTLDTRVRAVAVSDVEFSNDVGVVIMPDRAILELKFPVYLPTAFKRLIEEFRLTPHRISKYRLAMTTIADLKLTDSLGDFSDKAARQRVA